MAKQSKQTDTRGNLKAVWIPADLHGRIKAECKGRRPRINMADRVTILIERGIQSEQAALAFAREDA